MAQDTTAPRLLLLSPLLIAACTLSLLRSPLQVTTPPGNPVIESSTSVLPASTADPAAASPRVTETPLPPTQSRALFCDDERPAELIEKFKQAIRSADGALLASLVSPQHGMDARLLRDGRVVNYDREHAAALFDSTYIVDWGISPGSGLPAKGSFRELLVPDLMDVFSRQYSQACNTIQVGGATYDVRWPYEGIDFYSLHYAGSAEFGNLDWHTWAIGIHFVNEQPYLYAIMPFRWEP
jgi:hypothetical protein